MGAVFYLPNVVRAMDLLTPDPRSYLNRRTGELFSVTEVELAAARGQPCDFEADEQEVVKLREVLKSEDWLELPVRYTSQELEMMERFALTVAKGHARGELLRSARGPDPLLVYGETLDRRGLSEKYFDQFREQELSRLAEAWLQAHGIAYRK
jgi:hypothetical protein